MKRVSAMGDLNFQAQVPEQIQQEQRAEDRIVTVYRPAMIAVDGLVGMCLVKNLSRGGMMAQVFTDYSEGASIIAHFDSDFAVSGQVSWSDARQIGVKFFDDIDVGEMLGRSESSVSRGRTARSPRVPVECIGFVHCEGRTYPAKIHDISQKGVKISGFHPPEGAEVTVELNAMMPKKALVRWKRNGATGLNFVSHLSFEELTAWLIDRQNAERENVLGQNHWPVVGR